MPWFKVDDGLPSSRKVLGIPRRDRLAAIGLWTLLGAWSAKELQDGAVPRYMIVELGATRRVAEALVSAGLWLRTSSGYASVNWDDFQPTKADVLSAREKNAEKLRKWRCPQRHRSVGARRRHPRRPRLVRSLRDRPCVHLRERRHPAVGAASPQPRPCQPRRDPARPKAHLRRPSSRRRHHRPPH